MVLYPEQYSQVYADYDLLVYNQGKRKAEKSANMEDVELGITIAKSLQTSMGLEIIACHNLKADIFPFRDFIFSVGAWWDPGRAIDLESNT